MRIRRSTLAVSSITLSVLCALFLSGAALNDLGLNYSVDSSSGGFKLHPYTIFATLSVIALMSGPKACRRCLGNRQFRTAIAGALVTTVILVWKSVIGDGTSLGFAVDTIVSAFLIAAALAMVSPSTARRLSTLVLMFIVVECGMSAIEVFAHINLIPVDTWYGEYFRATALQGHPLNNALILVTAAIASQAYTRPGGSVAIFLLSSAALVAFGARGALAIYVLVNLFAFFRFGMASAQRALIFLVGGVVVAAAFSWLVFSGVAGDRIAQVGVYDSSSAVRVDSLGIVQQLGWPQLALGSGANDIGRLMDQANVGVIENFVVGYLLSFGAIFTAIIFYCVYRTCKVMVSGTGRFVRRRLLLIACVFVLTSLTNNSLVTKTPALYLLIVGLWCARCKLEALRDSPARVASGPIRTERSASFSR